MIKSIWLMVLLGLSSCASFKGVQEDISNEETGTRKITTTVKTRTFFDSKSELAKLAASQTDKTQTFKIGALNSESSGTNAVSLLEAVARGAVEGAAKAAIPVPRP